MRKPKVLKTDEALAYIAKRIGSNKRYNFHHMDTWRRHGRIKPYERVLYVGNVYTIRSLNALADTLPKPSPNPELESATRAELISILPNTLTDAEWQNALNYFNGCCAVCGRQLNDMFGQFRAAKDHWIPLQHGKDNPGTVVKNIVPLCHGVGGCNNRKYISMPNEWLKRKFGRRKAKQIAARVQAYFDSLVQEKQT